MATADKTVRTARARERLVARHAEMREVLDHWTGVLAATADAGIPVHPVRPVRNLLRAFLVDEVLPHARAEERTLYRAARRDSGAGPLVQALISEHRLLASRAGERAEPARPADAAAQAAAISALFASHVAKEDSLLLPALERSGADLPAMIGRESRLAGSQCAALDAAAPAGSRRGCDCQVGVAAGTRTRGPRPCLRQYRPVAPGTWPAPVPVAPSTSSPLSRAWVSRASPGVPRSAAHPMRRG